MDTSDVERGAQRVKGAATDMGGGLRSSLGGILGIAAGAAALVGVSLGMKSIVQNTVTVNSMIEQANARFKALGMSSAAAQKDVSNLMNFARTTPFETQSIINASEKLQLLGGNTLNTQHNLTLFGNAAAATGQSVDGMSNMFGRLYQAIENGQPVQRFAVQMERLGVLTPDVTLKLVQMQKAHASASQMWDLVTGSLGRFNGAMASQLGTWDGVTTAIHRAIADLEATAFKPLFTTLETGLVAVNTWLNSGKVEAAAVAFGKGLSVVLTGIVHLVAQAWNFLATSDATRPIRDFLGTIGGAVATFFRSLANNKGLVGSFGDALDALGDPGRHAHDVLDAIAGVLAPRLQFALQAVVPLMWSAVAAFTAFETLRGVIAVANSLETAFGAFTKGAEGLMGMSALRGGIAAILGLTELGPISLAVIAIGSVVAAMAGLYIFVPQVHQAMNSFVSWLGSTLGPVLSGAAGFFGQISRAAQLLAQTAWPALSRAGQTLWATLQTLFGAVNQIATAWDTTGKATTGAGRSFSDLNSRVSGMHSALALFASFLAIIIPNAIVTVMLWIKVASDGIMGIATAVVTAARVMADAAHGNWAQAANDMIAGMDRLNQENTTATTDMRNAWTQTAGWFNGSINDQINAFATQVDQVFAGLGGGSNRAAGIVRTNFGVMGEQSRQLARQMQGDAATIAGALPAALAAQKQAAITAMTDVGRGVLNALNGFVSPIQTTSRTIATSVATAIQQHNLTGSPSRLTYRLGQDVMMGYHLGLQSLMSRLSGTATSIAQAVSGAIGGGAAPNLAMAGAGGPTLPVNMLSPMMAASGPGGAGQSSVTYDIDQHFYQADLQPSDVSSEMAWLMKTRRKG